MRVAIPVRKRRLAKKFKDFEQVILLDTEAQKILQRKHLACPIIRPWMLPLWFREHDVDLLIVGNMDEIAIGLFKKLGLRSLQERRIFSLRNWLSSISQAIWSWKNKMTHSSENIGFSNAKIYR